MKKIALLVLLMGTIYLSPALLLHPVTSSYTAKHMGLPLQTTFSFTRSKQSENKGKSEETKSQGNYEYAFKVQVYYFGHRVTFKQTIRLNTVIEYDLKGARSLGCVSLQQLFEV